eukprot:TRINITY_DN2816_c0_g1_i1.p1 TRINITY_DN2816_c0_g1~~TRINITY_DN2816_c0_g1_i1.p1  ORF type:complete len:395 (+),score=125.47 TRINITY_DN2816_c0_g1_i1:92-1186(+)
MEDGLVDVAPDACVGQLREIIAAALAIEYPFTLSYRGVALADDEALADVDVLDGTRVDVAVSVAHIAKTQLAEMGYKATRDGLCDAVYHRDLKAVSCFAALQDEHVDDEIVFHLLGSLDTVQNFAALLQSLEEGRAGSGAMRLVDELFDIGKLDRRSLLHHVCTEGNNLFWGGNSAELAKVLVAHGADVTLPDSRGNAPLHYAACLNDSAVLHNLLSDPSDPAPSAAAASHEVSFNSSASSVASPPCPGALEPRDSCGRTPLHLAVTDYRYDHAEILLGAGADPNAQDAMKATPLHRALAKDRGDATAALVALLVRYGARGDVVDRKGKTPAEACRCKDQAAVLARLLKAREAGAVAKAMAASW